MTTFWVGTSGWVYRHWRGRFYPPALPQTAWFQYYSERFDTVELNNSFYRMPSEAAWRSWAARAPTGFRFAVKASRFITHLKRLKDCREPVSLLARRAGLLGTHLGPVLFQLPANFQRDDARLDEFLAVLPATLQAVFEFRHPSWFDEAVYRRLRRAGVGFCISLMPEGETPRWITGGVAYVRFHGTDALYSGSYSDEQLADWAQWLRALRPDVRDAYAYFNNDAEANAVRNAVTLRRLLDGGA
jgi:uncharacterized protein YecE (DUF72 family)